MNSIHIISDQPVKSFHFSWVEIITGLIFDQRYNLNFFDIMF